MAVPYPWSFALRIPYLRWCKPNMDPPRGFTAAALASRNTTITHPYRLLIAGDLMVTRNYQLPRACDSLKRLFERANCVVINCEAPVIDLPTPSERFSLVRDVFLKGELAPRFFIPREYLRNAVSEFGCSGETVLGVANNHMFDHGREGFRSTLDEISAVGAKTVGAQPNDVPPEVVVVGNAHLRIGLLAWTHWFNNKEEDPQFRLLEHADIKGIDVAALKRRYDLDFLVGYPHWDYEYYSAPCPETVALAEDLFADGFDIVAGHHSHTPGPILRHGPHLCAFGLGNLVGTQPHWSNRICVLLELMFDATGQTQHFEYRMHTYFQTRTEPVELMEIDQIEGRIREDVRGHLQRLYPDSAREGATDR